MEAFVMTNPNYEKCYRFLEQLPVISTHEHHLFDEEQQALTLAGVFDHSYVAWQGVPVGKTEKEHAEFLELVKYNSYYVWLEKGLQELYGLDGPLTPKNWDDVSRQIEEAHAEDSPRPSATDTDKRPSGQSGLHSSSPFHIDVLREKCRYKYGLTDIYRNPGSDPGHPYLFKPVFRSDVFISSFHPKALDHDENTPWLLFPQIEGYSFDEYTQFVIDLHRKNVESGAGPKARAGTKSGSVAFKFAMAYERSLAVRPADSTGPEKAASVFMKNPSEVSEEERALYGDYFIHHICRLAEEYDIPIQIHTGLGRLRGSNPMLLEPLIETYPNVKFVLFHGGYPWYHEIAALAHNHTNVFIDMVWLPIISTTAAVRALHEYIEVSPGSDRIAWGSDTWTSEEALGALLAYQHVTAKVVGEKLDDGYFSFESAKELMERLMYKNAEQVYGIQ